MATPDTVSFGYEQVPAGEKTAMVGEVFSRVARKYDIMNDAMSGGMHRLWKDRFVRRVKPREGETILDMAGGTGDIAFRMERFGASITVADINPDMPRWKIIWSSRSVDTMPYLARRDRLVTVAPVNRCARSAGKGRRRSGRKVVTATSLCPSRKGVRPRTVVSTSGSSGISTNRLRAICLRFNPWLKAGQTLFLPA